MDYFFCLFTKEIQRENWKKSKTNGIISFLEFSEVGTEIMNIADL